MSEEVRFDLNDYNNGVGAGGYEIIKNKKAVVDGDKIHSVNFSYDCGRLSVMVNGVEIIDELTSNDISVDLAF